MSVIFFIPKPLFDAEKLDENGRKCCMGGDLHSKLFDDSERKFLHLKNVKETRKNAEKPENSIVYQMFCTKNTILKFSQTMKFEIVVGR